MKSDEIRFHDVPRVGQVPWERRKFRKFCFSVSGTRSLRLGRMAASCGRWPLPRPRRRSPGCV